MAASSASMPVMTAWLVTVELLERFGGGPGEAIIGGEDRIDTVAVCGDGFLDQLLGFSRGPFGHVRIQNHIEFAVFDSEA